MDGTGQDDLAHAKYAHGLVDVVRPDEFVVQHRMPRGFERGVSDQVDGAIERHAGAHRLQHLRVVGNIGRDNAFGTRVIRRSNPKIVKLPEIPENSPDKPVDTRDEYGRHARIQSPLSTMCPRASSQSRDFRTRQHRTGGP